MKQTQITLFQLNEQDIKDAIIAAITKEYTNLQVYNPKYEWTDNSVTVTCTTEDNVVDTPAIVADTIAPEKLVAGTVNFTPEVLTKPEVKEVPVEPTKAPTKPASKTVSPFDTTPPKDSPTKAFADMFGLAQQEDGIVKPAKEFVPVPSVFPSFAVSK